ncbi:RNA 2'-O ribose methyltransferase substrate binding family protein [Streptococcus pyogenes]|uniref:TrmH family RNA methyltransferase n=1 Tax=Streptococcus pyogenes TaxID=1314 RepID=UPI0010A1F60D|nr:RNA methyltransferase [Streptococcus pyogenes]VGR75270.1 RNA 2'-O ribose methyltransferase substrate binding family protein [Streptococcus pyogenes]VGR78773.1 RNA 2'-O ribose methyltransferase substrate binding family protein [Streptococcus pyogenes]VGR90205.1 RNA 2'-O ribose methyltransferase substrate binding family protein [Streptococcus pyogenes]VGU38901.1 RNA 2'-O ribose methyltransferase substrate binding family protein [Streptococcus pyogenes]VGW87283.1 RNA 2'-O ribose methyltransfer
MVITSKANQLIKQTKKLLQKKHRKQSYLIEGWHLFEEAQKSGQVFRHIFVLEEMAERLAGEQELVIVSPQVLKELTDSPSPQGIVAEVEIPKLAFPSDYKGKYLVLEDVQDPGNLGTIIRTADAARFDGVFLSEKSADIYNQKTLRSMQGSHFHLPIWRTDVYQLCRELQEYKTPILATTLSKKSVDYKNLTHNERLALVLGNEGQGISAEMAALADQLVHITMPGQAESLNVAVAAGILIFSLI